MKVNPKQLSFLEIAQVHEYLQSTQNRWKCKNCTVIRENDEYQYLKELNTVIQSEICNPVKKPRLKKRFK